MSDDFLKSLRESILSCFHSLIKVYCQRSNFACISIHEFVFIGPLALLYYHEFA